AVLVVKGDNEDEILEAMLEADVDVTEVESEEGMITVIAPHTEYNKARMALTALLSGDSGDGNNVEFEVDTITFIPQTTMTISGDDVEMFEKFLDMLNDNDDVQNVYHNVDI
ncbi:MAG: YebC/PmpR family DNA-binding transcriptional regulator, partial [Gammaproteobacteria bacterium]|nr:YebC/PmpR family DNA-binding transcriptional regulator [Gammaproteobacteria bacterium]